VVARLDVDGEKPLVIFGPIGFVVRLLDLEASTARRSLPNNGIHSVAEKQDHTWKE
jgi:hypothetical protein